MTFEESVPLSLHTTFRIGGAARFFCRVRSVGDLADALAFAREKGMPFFLLGGGSNLLVSDAGFAGLVIKMEIGGMEFRDGQDGTVTANIGAGESWDEFVAEAVRRGLSGVENLSLIPGTVGAAPVQNIGAYGSEAKDSISSVEVLDVRTLKADILTAADCRFGYRDSVFKHPDGKFFIITRVRFSLSKNGALKTDYKDVKAYFEKKGIVAPTLADMRDAVVAIRTAKLPDISKLGTAGSFFKNPVVSEGKFAELKKSYPELPSFPEARGFVKIPAAWLLDKVCGFRGIREGDAGSYENQALVLVNYGNATAAEISALAQKMQDSVMEKTGIRLEREVVGI